MSKASERIDGLVNYFRSSGGVVRGGSLADVEEFANEDLNRRLIHAPWSAAPGQAFSNDNTGMIAKQIGGDLQKVTNGLFLVAEVRGRVVGMGLGYEQDDCYWINEVVSNGETRGTGTALMREFARHAQSAGKELRLQALRDTGALGFFDMLGARTVDHYNKRALGWKKTSLASLAGQPEIEIPSL